MSSEEIAQKRRDMGAYVYNCQMLLDPRADTTLGFRREDLPTTRRTITVSPRGTGRAAVLGAILSWK